MPNNNQQIKFSLKATEFDFIFSYQLADKPLLKKLTKIKNELIAKRPDYKRVSLVLTLGDIDTLLTNITKGSEKQNNTNVEQDLLDSLFGKLAQLYNDNLY